MKTDFGRHGVWPLTGVLASLLSANALAVWWEHPHDRWYLKDDWKAAEVANYSPRFQLKSPAASGWIAIWGSQGVVLRVNGQLVMKHVDRGLIYDADLTPFVQGAAEVTLQAGPGRVVAEGEWVDEQGRRYPFASGCDWSVPTLPGTPLPPAARPYRPGEASGAFHSAHNGRFIRYNDEERGKANISKALARLQKLRDQSIFLLRRFRPAEEILSSSPDTLWRRTEKYAASRMADVERILKEQAIPAQKRSDFTNAIALAAQAGTLLAAAERAVSAATEVEKAERHLTHLGACAELLSSVAADVRRLTSKPRDNQSLTSAATNITWKDHFAEVRRTLTSARDEAASDEWANVEKRVVIARERLAALDARLSQLWGAPVGKLDEFPEDRFGWLNTKKLMGNDPDEWEFSVINPAANWIDLRGGWWFRTDPLNKGEELGWHRSGTTLDGWRTIKVPCEWEREGVLDDNDQHPADCPYPLPDRRCEDKPYNGFAWYRHDVRVPPSWEGRKVVLRLGKVSNWLRVFLNGTPVGEPRRDGGVFPVSAELLKPGEINTVAIQVYNHDNFGGITGGPVSLAVDDLQPETVVTPGPMSFTTEKAVPTTKGVERFVTFASAMSPAVLLASDQPTLHLWGWEAKGCTPPSALKVMTASGELALDMALDAAEGTGEPPRLARQTGARLKSTEIPGAKLTESWVWLAGGQPGAGRVPARPALLVSERRPRAIRWDLNALGFAELTLSFDAGGARVLVLTLPAGTEWDAATWSARARSLRAVPVACSELARLDKAALRGQLLLRYHYFELSDFTDQPATRVAPVPMLLSYALKHRFPGLEVDEHRVSNCASEHAPYRLRPNTNTLSYATPLVDKSKLLKGVGELFAKRKPEFNARGGNTEARMFDDWKEWGFDHCRYAFAWGASWDVPLQKFMGGPISDDPELWTRMDYLVKQHTDRSLMAMLCYFFNEDSPQRDSKGLVRNSTRYWRMHPEVRTHCYELWRRIADRYKHLPDGAVAYDFFNEPAYMWRDDWNRIIKDLTRIVRSVDPRHLIVCEAGDGWSQPQWFHWLEPTGDTNTIYSFHHYGKHWGYDRDEYYPSYSWPPEKEIDILLEAILFGLRHNVPLHCGEFGVSQISPADDHLVWLDDYLGLFERFGIGWNWWNWSGSDIYRTGLKAGEEVSPNLAVLRKWIERKKTWR